MSEAKAHGKIDIKVGNLSFSAEGDQEWLGEQLSKVLKAASPAISQEAGADRQLVSHAAPNSSGGPFTTSLASYLKAKSAETKQVQKFLAAAAWLSRRGEENLTTTKIAKALADNQQKRLSNPSDCLNQNVSKGYCEKRADHFFITPEGWKALGEPQ